MSEPTGREMSTPVMIRDTSVTERAAFRKCRRQWLGHLVHRLGLPGGASHFLFGTAIHAGLAQGYQSVLDGGQVVVMDSQGAFQEDWEAAKQGLSEDLGFLWPSFREEYDELDTLGDGMLANYWAHDELKPVVLDVVSVEERYEVPILSPGGSTVGWLSAQMDLVGDDDHGRKIVDHKTASQRPNPAQLDFDDQLRGYVWARWKATGEWVQRAVYNALMKVVPHTPKRLKPGRDGKVKLSQDKQQVTTYDLYLKAIEDEGLERNDYAGFLLHLREEAPTLVIREGLWMSEGSIDEFERNLYNEFQDMKRVALRPDLAYPNPSPFNCPSCPIKTLCLAMINGEDAEEVIKSQYSILPPRR